MEVKIGLSSLKIFPKKSRRIMLVTRGITKNKEVIVYCFKSNRTKILASTSKELDIKLIITSPLGIDDQGYLSLSHNSKLCLFNKILSSK